MIRTEETREKMREAWKRRRLNGVSAETRQKLRDRKPHSISEAARLRMSLARKGVSRPCVAGPNSNFWKGGLQADIEHQRNRRRVRKAERRALGPLTVAEWNDLKAQYRNTCPACLRSEPQIRLTLDHIIPIMLGGTNARDNLQPLCGSCNSKKATKIIRYDS